jgi:hypothetical protein
MDDATLQRVIKSIQSDYPKTRACKPRVSKQADGRNLITFSYCDTLPGSKSISQSLRIVVDNQGRILKKSSSRG